MFLSLEYLLKDGGWYFYKITDSRFGAKQVDLKVATLRNIHDTQYAAFSTATVITFYRKQYPKEVAPNVALFYKWWNEVNIHTRRVKVVKDIDFECKWLDTYYPNLEYGSRYYRCVKNQMRMLNFRKGQPHKSITI